MCKVECTFVQGKLSAFHDDELQVSEAEQIEVHLQDCPACREQLRAFRSLTTAFAEASIPAAPELWPQIVNELGTCERSLPAPRRRLAWNARSPQLVGVLLLAASLLIVVGIWFGRGVIRSRLVASDQGSAAEHQQDAMVMSQEHRQQFVGVMDHYLAALPTHPDAAEEFLLAQYQGAKVSPDEAVSLIGYRPTIAAGLPAGYSLASSSVLKMPCCTCFKAVCRRSDGSTLVLFEHDDKEVAWFGDRPSSMAVCGQQDCCLVQLDSSIAATWKAGSRSVTAVGVKDQQEVTALVNWLEQASHQKQSGRAAAPG